jgi:hypothetical protein
VTMRSLQLEKYDGGHTAQSLRARRIVRPSASTSRVLELRVNQIDWHCETISEKGYPPIEWVN